MTLAEQNIVVVSCGNLLYPGHSSNRAWNESTCIVTVEPLAMLLRTVCK